MGFLHQIDRNDVQFAMTHAIGGDDLIGKLPDILHRAAQYHYFQAIVMIHVHMHAR